MTTECLADGLVAVITHLVYLRVSFMDLFCSIEILTHLRPQNRQIGFAVTFFPQRMTPDFLHAANALLDPCVL